MAHLEIFQCPVYNVTMNWNPYPSLSSQLYKCEWISYLQHDSLQKAIPTSAAFSEKQTPESTRSTGCVVWMLLQEQVDLSTEKKEKEAVPKEKDIPQTIRKAS